MVAVSSIVVTEVKVSTLVIVCETSSKSVNVTVTIDGAAVTVLVEVDVLQRRISSQTNIDHLFTYLGQGVIVFRINDEQSAVAEEANGEADEALTARRQLSALQVVQGDPRTRTASKDEMRIVAARILRVSSRTNVVVESLSRRGEGNSSRLDTKNNREGGGEEQPLLFHLRSRVKQPP